MPLFVDLNPAGVSLRSNGSMAQVIGVLTSNPQDLSFKDFLLL